MRLPHWSCHYGWNVLASVNGVQINCQVRLFGLHAINDYFISVCFHLSPICVQKAQTLMVIQRVTWERALLFHPNPSILPPLNKEGLFIYLGPFQENDQHKKLQWSTNSIRRKIEINRWLEQNSISVHLFTVSQINGNGQASCSLMLPSWFD